MKMTRKDELVLWVLQMVRGGEGQQQWWWRMFPFSSSTILPFNVLAEFNWLCLVSTFTIFDIGEGILEGKQSDFGGYNFVFHFANSFSTGSSQSSLCYS